MVNPRDAAQARRHELDELIIGGKNAKKYGNKGTTQVWKNGKLVGTHTSPRVIKREFERQKQIHNLYGSDKQSILPRVRKMTGEYQAVKNMTPKQIRKMERIASDQTPSKTSAIKELIRNIKKDPDYNVNNMKIGAQWNVSDKLHPSKYSDVPESFKNQIERNKQRAIKLKKAGKIAAAAALVIFTLTMIAKWRNRKER